MAGLSAPTDSCGWSDHIGIKCAVTTVTSPTTREYGPCSNAITSELPVCGDVNHAITPLDADEELVFTAMMAEEYY